MPNSLERRAHRRGLRCNDRLWQRLRRDKRGATAVLVAISLPILLAVAGLGIDVGWWYTVKRQNQSAADAAAISAAYEIIAGHAIASQADVATYLVPAAKSAANRNQASDYQTAALTAVYRATAGACTDPGGSYVCYQYGDSAVPAGVAVILRQQQNGWLSHFAALASLTIASRAVAEVSQLPPVCMLALGRNPPGTGPQNMAQTISIKGGGGVVDINAPHCSIVSDSDSSSGFYFQGNAKVTAGTLITPGQVKTVGGSYNLSLDDPAQVGANAVLDPYASTLTHANFLSEGLSTATACTSTTVGTVTTYTNPGGYQPGCVIAGGLSIKNATVNLSPGTYWLTGDLNLQNGTGAILECTSCTNGGAGVTIILTAPPGGGTVGTARLSANANLDLNAPSATTGSPFAGMVLIQDSNGLPAGVRLPNPDNFSTNANATETLSGLVYFPDAAVDFIGTPISIGPQCLLLISNTASFQGNSSLATDGCSSLGLNNFYPQTVLLAE